MNHVNNKERKCNDKFYDFYIILNIMEYLNIEEKLICSLVNKDFNNAFKSTIITLKNHVFDDIINNPNILLKIKNWHNSYKIIVSSSNSKLISKMSNEDLHLFKDFYGLKLFSDIVNTQVSDISMLNKLKIIYLDNFDNIEIIQNLTNLIQLNLRKCSIKTIKNCQNINYLNIYDCNNLIDNE
jgi:hypothetical protein